MQERSIKALFSGAALLSFGLATLATSSPTFAASQGVSGGTLAARIDAEIEAVMEANFIPGMTAAVTIDGRLVYSKGFGYARTGRRQGVLPSHPSPDIPMRNNMRTLIGSVSKAVVTGPTAFKLISDEGINTETTKLYGPGSIFGDKYKNDIKLGALRFSSIIGTAINNADKTYTWYTNGKVSIGSSNDLDRHQEPLPFKLPEGRIVTDIRAIAVSNSSRVYTWYNDGTRSIGASRDLGMHEQISLDSKGKKRKVKFPKGKSMLNVVGIAIAKTGADADHVYVWYEDGTLSSGTTMDFTAHFTNKSYSVAVGNPYAIRSMAISASDRVYT